jgi:hypothetical protein
MSRSPFKEGQIVVIRGLEAPFGCAVVVSELPNGAWCAKVEQDSKIEEREFCEGELRPLNRREKGA